MVHRTPVLTSRRLDVELGARLFFKCENLQRVGAFKFRGACNALLQLSPAQQQAGVATYSSGNHSQAIALAAQLLGIAATIVMPFDAPASKVAATAGYGARIVHYDRFTEDRVAICQRIAGQQGMAIIPPFDHPHVIAGQGTAALELFEEAGQLDALFVPLGGGGLLAGCLLAAQAMPGCRVYGVEPLAGNDAQQSLRCGEIVHIPTPATIADGAQTQAVGELTFPIIRQAVTDIVTVSDDELVEGMSLFAGCMKLVVEPTGCLGYAGARSMRDALRGLRVGVMVSGGNVDMARFAALVGKLAG
jgi:threo-3-hydroxy-L-aspartate ammonia-lyase